MAVQIVHSIEILALNHAQKAHPIVHTNRPILAAPQMALPHHADHHLITTNHQANIAHLQTATNHPVIVVHHQIVTSHQPHVEAQPIATSQLVIAAVLQTVMNQQANTVVHHQIAMNHQHLAEAALVAALVVALVPQQVAQAVVAMAAAADKALVPSKNLILQTLSNVLKNKLLHRFM